MRPDETGGAGDERAAEGIREQACPPGVLLQPVWAPGMFLLIIYLSIFALLFFSNSYLLLYL